jgi:phage FluMu protein gp41
VNTFIESLAAAVSAIAAGFAAWAAFLSARSASRSEEQVSKAEHRASLRELTLKVQNVLVESARAEATANQLKMENDALAQLSGIAHGSAHDQMQISVITKVNLVTSSRKKAELISSDYAKLRAASIEDLSQALAEVNGELAKVRTTQEELTAILMERITQRQIRQSPRS